MPDNHIRNTVPIYNHVSSVLSVVSLTVDGWAFQSNFLNKSKFVIVNHFSFRLKVLSFVTMHSNFCVRFMKTGQVSISPAIFCILKTLPYLSSATFIAEKGAGRKTWGVKRLNDTWPEAWYTLDILPVYTMFTPALATRVYFQWKVYIYALWASEIKTLAFTTFSGSTFKIERIEHALKLKQLDFGQSGTRIW